MNAVPIDLEKLQAETPTAIVIEHVLDGEVHQFAFQRPKRAHVDQATGKGTQSGSTRMNNLVMTLLIAPDRAHMIALLDYYPGLPVVLGNKLLEAVGMEEGQIVPLARKS